MLKLWHRNPAIIDLKLIERGRKLKEMRDESEPFGWFKKLIQEKAKSYHESMAKDILSAPESLPTLRGKVIALREISQELDDEIERGERELVRSKS